MTFFDRIAVDHAGRKEHMLFFIVNPNSGGGQGAGIWKKTKAYLEQENIAYQVYLTEKTGQAREFSSQITEDRSSEERILVVVGGDGTLNEVVDGLNISSRAALAYIPAGSGNDFARSMKISHNPVAAIRKITENPEYRIVDYGVVCAGKEEVSNRRFCVSCGIGFDAAICHTLLHSKIKNHMKRIHMNKIVYVIVGIRQICRSKPVTGTIILDNDRKVNLKKVWFASCHVHSYEGGGFCLAPGADYSDGKLEVCIVHGIGRKGLIAIMLGALMRGHHCHLKGVHQYSCREAVFQMKEPMAVHTDGESCYMQTDMTVTCMDRKLKFIV